MHTYMYYEWDIPFGTDCVQKANDMSVYEQNIGHACILHIRTHTHQQQTKCCRCGLFLTLSLSSFSEGLAERKWKKPLTFFGYYEMNMDGFFRSVSYIVYIYKLCNLFCVRRMAMDKRDARNSLPKNESSNKSEFCLCFCMACLQFVFVEMLT